MQKATKDFLGKPAPPNYVAGLARGATGFTTRSDIGPAREGAFEPAPLQKPTDDQNEDPNQDPENEVGLFNSAPYEEDDEEADQIWKSIDDVMDQRRKTRREKRERQELEEYRQKRPAIQEQFSDLRRQLSDFSEADWESIPEATNQSGHRRKKESKFERFSAVPDSLISSSANQIAQQAVEESSGVETPLSTSGMITNFVDIGRAKDRALNVKLDQIEETIAGSASVDPRGYLTSLESVVIKSASEIGDIQKARTLLKSVTKTNPKHAPGWIAAARLEEVAGKLPAARATIRKGYEECPKSEDVWLEASRLNTNENAKIILGNAVKQLPQSVKIWQAAADLEKDVIKRKRVYRRALEFVPTSVALWKAVVALEEPDDAKVLLSRAVELIPQSVELWLALARLETYENAKTILNKARSAIPTSHEVWISAAQLEESQQKPVNNIISRAFKNSAMVRGLSRETWIAQAEASELQGFPLVAAAIIHSCISIGLEDQDELYKLDIWVEDAQASLARARVETSRAIYAYALKTVPSDPDLWMSAAQLERKHGSPESLDSLLRKAVEYCPQTESLWLMAAKEKWVWANDIDGARTVLREAFRFNPNSEAIWLAAVKLESANQEYDRARVLLERARDDNHGAGTPRVWLKSSTLERQLKNPQTALELATTGTTKFPKFPKLWMVKGQIEWLDMSNPTQARDTFSRGLKHNPQSIPLWILASKLECDAFSMHIKARAILDRARVVNPKCPELWLQAVRIEASNPSGAKSLLSRALKECPKSGILWSEAILLESRQQRKAKSVDALKNCDNNDPIIITTIARLFWSERRVDKARSWFERAGRLDPDYGDGWAWWLKFEQEQESILSQPTTNQKQNPGNSNKIEPPQESEKQMSQKVIEAVTLANPKHGEIWQTVAKDPSNALLSPPEILKLVVKKLPIPMPY
ncbi:hypothetical protein BB559_004862 [Furculomyces boomerangus]|uniref:PRP1 splicing factor N-terminal domain-containing protein n=1 Tax=Furculomyces boomerangus TaxID=61424 RepID=A0A2T9YC53_9FUNG|nr:hypothetical protein BB559_005620 [Furculomyces boomerangus]PVU89927.1 hypothetical protein BB559_004862 [Furculomyces boomerangus]